MVPGAHPTGSMGASECLFLVAFHGPVNPGTGRGHPTIVCCIQEVKGAGGGIAPGAGIAGNGTGAVGGFLV
jgi:hypothetical protein